MNDTPSNREICKIKEEGGELKFEKYTKVF